VKSVSSRMGSLPNRARAATSGAQRGELALLRGKLLAVSRLSVELMGVLPA
jgi:hypothetical protein